MNTKRLYMAFIICIVLGLAGWFSVRAALIHIAEGKAEEIIEAAQTQATLQSDGALVEAVASVIFERFTHQNASDIALYKIRPLVTNYRLPDFFKLPDGIMETLLERGYCDSAVRMTGFVLSQKDIEYKQWSMIIPSTAHSAMQVSLKNGKKMFVDPFYGYVVQDSDGNYIHLPEAKVLINQGIPFDNVFKSLGKNSDHRFYKNLNKMISSVAGDKVIIETIIPEIKDDKVFTLGQIDHKSQDVKIAAMRARMMPHWEYAGHKFNRQWVRVLKAQQPVKVTFTLVDDVQEGIVTATPKPQTQGKEMIWALRAGEEIRFEDGLAKPSLLRMNSYIGVDQIKFSPAD